jgi:hypothetical protein
MSTPDGIAALLMLGAVVAAALGYIAGRIR